MALDIQDAPAQEAAVAPLAERTDPYMEWQRREGVPVIGGVYVRNLRTAELGDWPRKGVKGAIVYLDGDDQWDSQVLEVPPGGSTTPQRHLYDECTYVLSGRGATTVWFDDDTKQTFEWGEGSFFAVPTNARYQYHNGSGSEAARLYSVTSLPALLRQFHDESFIFNNSHKFTDRFKGEHDYFSGEGKLWRGRMWETNFEPDVRRMKLWEWKERGGGGTNAFFMLNGGTIESHISRFQTGTYKKGHRSPPGSHIFMLEGEGYTTTQRGDDEPMIRYDWEPGSLFLSGCGSGGWYHQHFNVSPAPATYIVLRLTKSRKFVNNRWEIDSRTDRNLADVDVKDGGIQTEYQDENPEVHAVFEEELRKRGVLCRMRNLSPFCTGDPADSW
jgi:quercetin dioxygenase-like cupin family protein